MTPVSEQRLFIRMMRFNLLLGMSVGMWVMLIGIDAYGFFLRPVLFFNWPLGPFQIILSGAVFVFCGEAIHSRSRFLAFRQKANGINASRWAFVQFQRRIFKSVGFFIIGLGLFLLISKPLKLPNPILSTNQQIFLTALLALIWLGIIGMSWFFYLRDKRHDAQEVQEGKF